MNSHYHTGTTTMDANGMTAMNPGSQPMLLDVVGDTRTAAAMGVPAPAVPLATGEKAALRDCCRASLVVTAAATGSAGDPNQLSRTCFRARNTSDVAIQQ